MLRGRLGAMASVLLGTLAVGACQQFTSRWETPPAMGLPSEVPHTDEWPDTQRGHR
jgi:hypothetical protein